MRAPAQPWPIVVVTTFFPSSVDPHRTVFVSNLVAAMRRQRSVTLIAPVPRRPWPARWSRPLPAAAETIQGMTVSRPRFLSIPGADWLNASTYLAAIAGILGELRRLSGRFVLHAHCAYPDGVGVALAARRLGLPCVITAHGSDINVHSRRTLLRPQIAWALKRVSAVVAVSSALDEQIAALIGSAGTLRACIPCAGFDPEIFALRDPMAARVRCGIAASNRVVVFVGQLVAVKQVDRLICAWGSLHAQGGVQAADRLIVIGAGPNDGQLRRLAIERGVEGSVLFTGALTQSDVSQWLSAADLLCLPSRNEGMPNVVIEALASGVPVVASRVGGIPEWVVDGLNGALVPAGDAVALAGALRRCLGRSWDRQALRHSVAHLTWDEIARRNLELIDHVTAGIDHAAVA